MKENRALQRGIIRAAHFIQYGKTGRQSLRAEFWKTVKQAAKAWNTWCRNDFT